MGRALAKRLLNGGFAAVRFYPPYDFESRGTYTLDTQARD